MSDEMPDHEADKAVAAEYALGLLPPDEVAAFEARLAEDPALRALYAEWCEDLTALTDRIEPVAPPSRVFRRVETEIFGARPAPRHRWRNRIVGLGSLAAAALVAAVLLLGPGMQDRGPMPPESPDYVAQVEAEDRSLVVGAAYDAGAGRLFVERQQGAARAGRALELWLIAGDAAPVSLGVLPDAARADIAVPDALRPRLEGGVLAISDEPPGGSPTGVPTGDVLAVGQITTL